MDLPWPLPDHPGLRDRLLAAWSHPARGYHDLRHLAEVLARLDVLLTGSHDERQQRVLRLAAWFHDAVYAGAPDDEERSAEWAEDDLPAVNVAPDEVAEVARLVRLTAGHDPADDDHAGALLCDADLGVLAADTQRYQEYVDGVRRDYAHVPDEAFAQGRAAVLADLLHRDRLFRTEAGRRLWDDRARANLRGELDRLEGAEHPV